MTDKSSDSVPVRCAIGAVLDALLISLLVALIAEAAYGPSDGRLQVAGFGLAGVWILSAALLVSLSPARTVVEVLTGCELRRAAERKRFA